MSVVHNFSDRTVDIIDTRLDTVFGAWDVVHVSDEVGRTASLRRPFTYSPRHRAAGPAV